MNRNRKKKSAFLTKCIDNHARQHEEKDVGPNPYLPKGAFTENILFGALRSTANEERKMTRTCASQKTTKITATTKESGEALTRQAVRHPCSGG